MCTNSNLPFSITRTSSGESNRFRITSISLALIRSAAARAELSYPIQQSHRCHDDQKDSDNFCCRTVGLLLSNCRATDVFCDDRDDAEKREDNTCKKLNPTIVPTFHSPVVRR